MVDWATDIERRNYGIRVGSGIAASELLRAILLLVPIAGVLLFQLWVRNQVTILGYENSELSKMEDALLRTQEKLVLEEEQQQSPRVVENLAVGKLGMVPLQPEQLLIPRIPSTPSDHSGRSIMAMVNRDEH